MEPRMNPGLLVLETLISESQLRARRLKRCGLREGEMNKARAGKTARKQMKEIVPQRILRSIWDIVCVEEFGV